MASLFVIEGRDQGKRFELDDAEIGLGRDSRNSIQLQDSEVSRQHAKLTRSSDGFELVDLSSSNGTFVNNRRVTRHTICSGDRVQIGRTLMIFTGNEERSSIDLAEEIDIIGCDLQQEASRIISSISQEQGSRIFTDDEASDSPWLARARSNLQIMYRTALAVSHTLDIEQLLDRILELIFEWVEADRGCVMLFDRPSGELAPQAYRARKGTDQEEAPADADPNKMQISQTILDYVMERQEGVLTSNAREDERWDTAASILQMGVREAICVPMQGRYGVVGIVYIDTYTPPGRVIANRHVNRFSDEHLKLMVAIGHQAALAVEDTSYYMAMVQAERLAAVGQTIATLSHHVKNILQGIRGGSYLIEEGLKANETDLIRKGWNIVDKNQDKISNLVMDMLTFSKERKPEKVSADLNEVTGEVIELMRTRANDAGVALLWKPAGDLPNLTFDPDALQRAILNVVTNAIDACEKIEAGHVTVSTAYLPEESIARVLVEDNGEGIPPEDVTRIFSVFESRKGSRGTGLGLPVSQKILREHGGDIRVESKPHVGSRFCLELPAVVASRHPAADRAADADDGVDQLQTVNLPVRRSSDPP